MPSPVSLDHRGEQLEGFEALPFSVAARPALEELPRPRLTVVVPKLTEGFPSAEYAVLSRWLAASNSLRFLRAGPLRFCGVRQQRILLALTKVRALPLKRANSCFAHLVERLAQMAEDVVELVEQDRRLRSILSGRGLRETASTYIHMTANRTFWACLFAQERRNRLFNFILINKTHPCSPRCDPLRRTRSAGVLLQVAHDDAVYSCPLRTEISSIPITFGRGLPMRFSCPLHVLLLESLDRVPVQDSTLRPRP